MADKDANPLGDNAILAVNQNKITALLGQDRNSVKLVDGQNFNFNYRPFLLAWLAYERLLDSNHIIHYLQHDRPLNQLDAALLDPTSAQVAQLVDEARHYLKTNRSLPGFGPIQLRRHRYSYGYTQNGTIVLNSDLAATGLTIAQELRVAFIIFLTLAHETGHLKLRRIVAGKPPNISAYNGALSGGGITPEKLPLKGESGNFIDRSLFELDHLAHSPNFHNLRADGIPHIRLDYIIHALSAPIPPSLSYTAWSAENQDLKLADSDDDDAGPRIRGKRKRELDDAVEKAAKKPKTDTEVTSTTTAGSPTTSTMSLSQSSPPLPAWMTVIDALKPPLNSKLIHDTLTSLGALTSRQCFEVMDYITFKPWSLDLKCAAADVMLSDCDPASFYLTDEEVAKWGTSTSPETLQHARLREGAPEQPKSSS